MDIQNGPGGHLSIEQAAALLGVSPRHVRRLISSGQLAGDTGPYRTRKEAVDAYRLRQQGVRVVGDVLPASDNGRGQGDTSGAQSDREVLLVALREIERLALQVGRLEAELEHSRQSQGHGGQQQGHGGQRRGTLARLGPWLRGGERMLR